MDNQNAPDEEMLAVMARFFHYSFKDIGYKYYELTDEEKALCTRAQFEKLITWVKGQKP